MKVRCAPVLAVLLLLGLEGFSQPLPMLSPRFGMCSAQSGDSAYLIGGGRGEMHDLHGTAIVEVLNVRTGRWDTVSSLLTPRLFAAAVTFGDRIYVMGGMDADGKVLNSLEAYDRSSNSWQLKAPMTRRRYAFAAVEYDSAIYVFGGGSQEDSLLNDVERYSIADNSWEKQPPLRIARAFHAVQKGSNTIYVIGGVNRLGPLNSIEKYQSGIGSSFSRSPLPTPRMRFGIIRRDTACLVISGDGPIGGLRNVEVLDFRNESTYSLLTVPLKVPRTAFSAIEAPDHKIYLIGGFTTDYKNGSAPNPSVDVLSLSTAVLEESIAPPMSTHLSQNYPNPFNSSTSIPFEVAGQTSNVTLVVYSILGAEVRRLVDEPLVPGRYSVAFDGSSLSSGIYVCKLITSGGVSSRKMILMK